MQQGKNLAAIFEKEDNNPENDENGVLSQDKLLNLPVMYLGPLQNADAINQLVGRDVAPDGAAVNSLETKPVPNSWRLPGAAANVPAMDREVKANDFPQRRCTVFPGFPSQHGNPRHGGNNRNQQGETLANNRVRKQEVIAINQTANSHDAMLAFVQIMCKRFFTCKQELFVETAADDKTPNSHITQAQAAANYGGLTRLALTSNDYARLFAHLRDALETPNQWEIVIVRPNIEHNMLAAVLGRGGSDELGSTFWGQTELSCYDDSMHGIWYGICSMRVCESKFTDAD
jgi:hypothetical protein